MSPWHWILGVLALVGLAGLLYGLDRLGLWLEDRGWLYYRRKKPQSSPMGMWVALQQAIEPRVRHVQEVEQHRRQEDEGPKEKLRACLQDCLVAEPVDREKIRLYLSYAQDKGWDWERLYREAVEQVLCRRPEKKGQIPSAGDVAPG